MYWKKTALAWALGAGTLLALTVGHAETQVVVNRQESAEALPGFRFREVPPPAVNDAATKATFTLVDGKRDPNGGELAVLHDGKVPADEDVPRDNFFFAAGTDGGRLQADLGSVIAIKEIHTYSWHAATRGPQVYKVYGSDGKAGGFEAQPKKGTDPEKCGWALVASVDTRPGKGEPGGQYGVSITNSNGVVGQYQYLLFDIARTEDKDPFGNTFFGEIDVIGQDGPTPEFVAAEQGKSIRQTIEVEGGKYKVTVDTSETPDLTEWVEKQVVPMVKEWYPQLEKMLPSEGFSVPAKFTIVFSKNMQGVAATSGTRIRCAGRWFRQNLKGEALGALFHEMVHVVQQYGHTRVAGNYSRPPGWLTEGLTDYIRFYRFEPQTHGAEISKGRLSSARYNGSYRVTANFINWVSEKHGTNFVPRLNALIREGKYNEEQWKELTGHPVGELGDLWKAELEKKLGQGAAAPASK